MTGSEPIFETLPTGSQIAEWFKDAARTFQNQGGDATWLCREPHGWLWHLATVDHDDQVFWLLVIGTADTQDLLFVTSGLRERIAYRWRGHPSTEQEWGHDAIVWMAGLIETYEAQWAAQSDRAFTDANARYQSRRLAATHSQSDEVG